MTKRINLKNILIESAPGYENRKFGESLPTLDSVQRAYKLKNILEGEDADGVVCESCGKIHEGECMKEHTINFTKEEMAALHNTGKLVKKDEEGKDHTYLFGEGEDDDNIPTGSYNEGSLTEGFATWKMQFAPMKLSGVDLDPKKTYTVKARSTVEAIKKASKMAGLKGDSWMATQTHKLVKVG